MKVNHPIEVAKTVLEVADVAWTAVECCHHYHHDGHKEAPSPPSLQSNKVGEDLEALRSENQRLRQLLEQNLNILQPISQSPKLLQDCPSDLHDRLISAVDSANFLKQLESLHPNSAPGAVCKFPFQEASDVDMETAEVLIKIDNEEPSWWVWVTDDMVPSNVEERSGLDNDNYVIVNEEQVVDAVANFMARCVLANPKAQNMSPEQLQKSLKKGLGGMNKLETVLNIWHAGKLFYALSTWGLALAGLYSTRSVLKLAAKGVHTTSKVVMRAL
ncbi:uncharacterized protein LOC116000910 isoform X1 [Ipomoea triloba]|uniref:uncharacterized protein LOC116000910 isoform X1 n=1 Tax=Ipomoea triloba TaxID=35885 RepID=UPI00125E1349|nr:uncharacterized protein LOC116000910 isoform X1 [Ipomoea triloba]GLL44006.1 uncharacterized protein LOC109175495 isoform X1 [Ipomoea trifida]